MAQGGTRLYCSNCKSESACRAHSPRILGRPKQQRVTHEKYDDLHWFSRGRVCSCCGHRFLTGELDEAFIHELVDLRKAWLKKVRAFATNACRKCKLKSRAETISLEEAQAFIRKVTYWDHPTSFPRYVNAPRHSHRIYKHSLGWAVDFGANIFLPGMAIARCYRDMAQIFHELEFGKICFREDAIGRLARSISGCVATQDGNEYNGFYPMDGAYLRFGTQLIDATSGAELILETADTHQILLRRVPSYQL